ncbi:Hypothetical predicted protein [Xyrichtys novacula]|uniref:Uncharacterized protein n=1 Tax=Xyrichtys novacula TaxID=13765 RepID=A0AAV1G7M8_XYRNO|nr:Hypothetical predicted protein [Xyrichtys novacula]
MHVSKEPPTGAGAVLIASLPEDKPGPSGTAPARRWQQQQKDEKKREEEEEVCEEEKEEDEDDDNINPAAQQPHSRGQKKRRPASDALLALLREEIAYQRQAEARSQEWREGMLALFERMVDLISIYVTIIFTLI